MCQKTTLQRMVSMDARSGKWQHISCTCWGCMNSSDRVGSACFASQSVNQLMVPQVPKRAALTSELVRKQHAGKDWQAQLSGGGSLDCVEDSLDLCKLAYLQVPALPECPLGKRLHLQLLQPVWQRHRAWHQLRQDALHIRSTANAREGFRR